MTLYAIEAGDGEVVARNMTEDLILPSILSIFENNPAAAVEVYIDEVIGDDAERNDL